MKRIRCLLMICLLCLPLCAQGQTNWEITRFTDKALQRATPETAYRVTLRLRDGAEDGDLSFLQQLPQLGWLTIENAFLLDDLSDIAALTQLEHLSILGGTFQDLGALPRLSNLKYLRLENCAVKDISALAEMPQLVYLALEECPEITDFSALNQLTRLYLLYFYKVQLSDVSFVRNMPELESLDFSCTQVSDISPLAYCKRLNTVGFNDCQVTDYTVLRDLPELFQVSLERNPPGDLRPLAESHALYIYATLPNGESTGDACQVQLYVDSTPQEQAVMFQEAWWEQEGNLERLFAYEER